MVRGTGCGDVDHLDAIGPFQSHMHRYRLELAQCGGSAGHALLRTFIDSFLFDLHAGEAGVLQGGVLCDPRSR